MPVNGLSQQVMPDALSFKIASFVLSILQGEGETKIMRRINSSPKGSHVIVGNDSDIILMSMMCPVKQLYILAQHTQGKSSRFNCISLDALDLPKQGSAQESGAVHALVCAVLMCCAVLCRAAVLCHAVLDCAGDMLCCTTSCSAVQAVPFAHEANSNCINQHSLPKP